MAELILGALPWSTPRSFAALVLRAEVAATVGDGARLASRATETRAVVPQALKAAHDLARLAHLEAHLAEAAL